MTSSRASIGRGARRWWRRFRPGRGMTLLVGVMLPLVIGLGAWQLERAEEKRAYEDRYYQRVGMLAEAPPARLEDADFLRVRLRGRFAPGEHFLVDNRVQGGRPGYWVVTRFRSEEGQHWLVNRGWLAAPRDRAELPAVQTPAGTLELTGVLWPDTGLPPLLAPDPWPPGWPKRVQRLDVRRMAAQAPGTVPVEVRLESGQPGAFAAAPVDAVFSPGRHVGYAVQWFALAGALLAAYVVFGFRGSSEQASE